MLSGTHREPKERETECRSPRGSASDEQIRDSRGGHSPDSKVEAALQFAQQVVAQRGWVSDEDLANVRDAGYGDAEIAEIIANVAQTIFSNYFNHVAEPVVDFPAVESAQAEPACACG